VALNPAGSVVGVVLVVSVLVLVVISSSRSARRRWLRATTPCCGLKTFVAALLRRVNNKSVVAAHTATFYTGSGGNVSI
jgi:hypothetical protein